MYIESWLLGMAQIYGWLKSTDHSNLRMAQIYCSVPNVPDIMLMQTFWPEILTKLLPTSRFDVINIYFCGMELCLHKHDKRLWTSSVCSKCYGYSSCSLSRIHVMITMPLVPQQQSVNSSTRIMWVKSIGWSLRQVERWKNCSRYLSTCQSDI